MTATEIASQARERVPANLESLRRMRQLTYKELAEEIGLSMSGCHKRLNGHVDISAQELAVFGSFFEVPISYLYLPDEDFLERLHDLGFRRFFRNDGLPLQLPLTTKAA